MGVFLYIIRIFRQLQEKFLINYLLNCGVGQNFKNAENIQCLYIIYCIYKYLSFYIKII